MSELNMISKMFLAGILVMILASSPISMARGEEAVIEGLRVEREKETLSISFWVKNCFNEEMEEAIRTGVPTTFNFLVKLHRKRSLIWDKKIARHRFQHNIVYDNLKKDFRIWLQEKGQEIRIKDLEKAKVSMQRVEGFAVVAGKELKTGEYKLAIKAELDPVKLPLRLECILFFVSLWDFETDWHYYTFRVEP